MVENSMGEGLNYLKLGVSSSKEDVKNAISNVDPGLFKGAFCKVVPDILMGDPAWCTIAHADGAGTKSIIAYLHFKETGEAKAFRHISTDSIVMNIDDVLCVGATGPFILSNTINRNKRLITGAVLSEIVQGYEDFIRMVGKHGIEIASSGGETADLGDSVRTIVVDSTLVTRMKRADVVEERIRPGDQIIGLGGFGTSSYDLVENSGIGGNGLTLARHALLSSDYDTITDSYDQGLGAALGHKGPFQLSDRPRGLSMSVGEALLSPTRTFAPVVRHILLKNRSAIHGMVHCTGGGQVKCKNFGQRIRYVKDDLFPLPPIFRLIQESGNVSWSEMYHTFNMGHRMEIFVPPAYAEEVIEAAGRFGVPAKVIGRCEKGPAGNSVEIVSEFGRITF
jgi:phosphoribosylformylglycinamidine cyclo-ligase